MPGLALNRARAFLNVSIKNGNRVGPSGVALRNDLIGQIVLADVVAHDGGFELRVTVVGRRSDLNAGFLIRNAMLLGMSMRSPAASASMKAWLSSAFPFPLGAKFHDVDRIAAHGKPLLSLIHPYSTAVIGYPRQTSGMSRSRKLVFFEAGKKAKFFF